MIGILLYQFINRHPKKSFSYLKSSIYKFVILMIFVTFFFFHNEVSQVYRYSIYYWIPMVLIIYIFSIGSGFFSNLLSSKILVYLGEISFGFYLIHQLVIRYFKGFIVLFDYNIELITQSIVVFVISIFLSVLSFEFFENNVRVKFKPLILKNIDRFKNFNKSR